MSVNFSKNPINQHSLQSLELWLSNLGAVKDTHNQSKWYLLLPTWNAIIIFEQQDEIAENQIFDLAESAFSRFKGKMNFLNIKIKSNIFLDFDSKKVIAIQPSLNKFDIIDREKIESSKNYVIYKLDKNLLYNILQGPRFAHWNNAEIGSHIKFFRNPNKFERNLYLGMCYYHN